MPFTAADLAAIDTAIASGEMVVQFGDRRVQYRSIAELKQARALVADQQSRVSSESEGRRPSRLIGTMSGGKGI